MSNNILENKELIKQELVNYGFGNQQSERMSLYYDDLNTDYIKTIRENNSFLEQLGFTKEEVINFAGSIVKFYTLSKEDIQRRIDEIVSLGITREEAINLCKKTRIFGTVGRSKEHMSDVMALGYSKEQTIEMLKNNYELYLDLGVNKNTWLDLFKKFTLVGFEKQELLEMIKNNKINYVNIFDYKGAMENVEIAQLAITKLLSSGISKENVLNEYRKLYLSMKQEEAQARFNETQEPSVGMSRK